MGKRQAKLSRLCCREITIRRCWVLLPLATCLLGYIAGSITPAPSQTRRRLVPNTLLRGSRCNYCKVNSSYDQAKIDKEFKLGVKTVPVTKDGKQKLVNFRHPTFSLSYALWYNFLEVKTPQMRDSIMQLLVEKSNIEELEKIFLCGKKILINIF